MGMFDTIRVPCPKCGEKADFQTKGGECILGYYEMDEAPADAMSDVNRHSPHKCEKCNTWFEVALDVEWIIKRKEVVAVDPPCWCHRTAVGGPKCPLHQTKG